MFSMANFNTHITSSAFLGVGYGIVGHTLYEMPVSSSVLSAGFCTVAGILPDVDADRGNSLREIMAFLAAVVPLLLLHRAMDMGYGHETLILLGAGVYLVIRFGGAEVIRRVTVHRGMWHSIPAALIAGIATFWLCDCPDQSRQFYKAGAVVSGFVWHLLLDEIYAVDTSGFKPRIKRSFGTALKIFGKKPFPNIFVYGLLFLMVATTMNEGHKNLFDFGRHAPSATTTPQPDWSNTTEPLHTHPLQPDRHYDSHGIPNVDWRPSDR